MYAPKSGRTVVPVKINNDDEIKRTKEIIGRKGGRAVYCTGLENRRRRKASVGSNPSPSADFPRSPEKIRVSFLDGAQCGEPDQIYV